jgi:hypothetical protein
MFEDLRRDRLNVKEIVTEIYYLLQLAPNFPKWIKIWRKKIVKAQLNFSGTCKYIMTVIVFKPMFLER